MTAKHTPGPWHFRKDGNVKLLDSEAKDPTNKYSLVSFGDAEYYPWASASDADWQLISAAPDLLAVLKRLFELDVDCYCDQGPQGEGWQSDELEKAFNDAQTAIAKAEGRT